MNALNPSKLTVVGFFLLMWVFPTSAQATTTQAFCNDWNGSSCTFSTISYTRLKIYNGIYPDTSNLFSDSGIGVFNANTLTPNIENDSFYLFTTDIDNYLYFQFYKDIGILYATTTPQPTIPITKNIEIIDPTYGTTTATTTYKYRIKFKTPFSLDFRPTTTRMVEIRDAISQEIEYISTTTIPANSAENIIFERNATTTIGSKYIRALYLDINGNPYSEIDEVFFNVATNTYYALTGLISPKDNTSDLSQINCELFDIGCQFQKAITFLFVPSHTVLDKFKNLWQVIAEKKPFGYVTKTIEQLNALDTTGAVAFDLGTIPFMDAIFTPFRTLIASILWALFAIYFYKNRLIHLDI